MGDDLIKLLQQLGDAEHDDLSVAHDALAEIVRLRMDYAEVVEQNERLHQEIQRLKGGCPHGSVGWCPQCYMEANVS